MSVEGPPERTRVDVGDVTLPAVDVWDFDGEDWVAFHVCAEDMIACRQVPANELVTVHAPGFGVSPVRATLKSVQFEERTVTIYFSILDADVDAPPDDDAGPTCPAGNDREQFVYEEGEI